MLLIEANLQLTESKGGYKMRNRANRAWSIIVACACLAAAGEQARAAARVVAEPDRKVRPGVEINAWGAAAKLITCARVPPVASVTVSRRKV